MVKKNYSLIRFELSQPNQTIPFPGVPALDVGNDGVSVPVMATPELRSHIKQATYTLTVMGRITYEDFTGREHWLTFCHQSNGLLGGSPQCFDFKNFDNDKSKATR